MTLSIGLQTVNHLGIEEILHKVKDLNLSAFEVFFDKYLPKDISPYCRDWFNKLNDDPGFTLTIHGPLEDISNSSWLEIMGDCLEFAHQYGAKLFTIHPGLDLSTFLKKAQKLVEMAVRDYEGIQIAIENIPSTPADVMNKILGELRKYRNVGLTFDIGHSQLAPISPREQKRSAVDYLKRLKAPILECHVHANRGEQDEHLSICDKSGVIDVERIICTLISQKHFRGPFILEYFRGNMKKDVQYIKKLIT